ncbi:hypothetical protein [Mycobacterium sp. P7213]|uniref:hypothetical protein n=1 Tax=Mycobacterium sp. P7213 TaxID=2478465 RepID=UPI0004206EDC|nr:hypothetical protein [Mycobacterium sp. P7213]
MCDYPLQVTQRELQYLTDVGGRSAHIGVNAGGGEIDPDSAGQNGEGAHLGVKT